MQETSTKPYFMRALYEWCTDNGYTPYMVVKVGRSAQVPMEFVRNGEIVLNISFGATSGLKMDNEAVRFKARFGGVSRDIYVPIANVAALYASENGQGMAFEVDLSESEPQASEKPGLGLAVSSPVGEAEPVAEQKKSTRPSLKVIK